MGLIIIPGEPDPPEDRPILFAGDDLVEHLDEDEGPATQLLTFEDLERLIAEQVEVLRKIKDRPTRAQASLDAAAIAAAEEGEVHLASALLLLSAHRVAAVQHLANQALMQLAVDLGINTRVRRCRACGCTDDNACRDAMGRPCHWREEDLCSHCAGRGR
jgi:hypothetical protein